ncbi:hypothetical protein GCM10010244_85150 [Streptomyces coeruleorubidus]|nr:hypothetical protein GCM10010244_85150 [Streptomyces bellus]
MALAVCGVTLVITVLWVEHRALLLWVLLIVALLTTQGLREAKRGPTDGRD